MPCVASGAKVAYLQLAPSARRTFLYAAERILVGSEACPFLRVRTGTKLA